MCLVAPQTAAVAITARSAVVAEVGADRVQYAPGCTDGTKCTSDAGFPEAVAAVNGAAVVVAVMGTFERRGPSLQSLFTPL